MALVILKLILELAVYFARRAQREDLVESLTDEVEILNGTRVRKAAAARDDVLSGRVQPDPKDPYQRD